MKIDKSLFWPFEDFDLVTRLSVDEAKARLASLVGPSGSIVSKLAPSKADVRPFEGSIVGDRIVIERFHGRNSFFSPVVDAESSRLPEGSCLRVRMRLSYPVMAFMAAWLGLSGLITVLGVLGALFSSNGAGSLMAAVFLPAMVFLWGYIICIVGFKLDSRNIRIFLEASLG